MGYGIYNDADNNGTYSGGSYSEGVDPNASPSGFGSSMGATSGSGPNRIGGYDTSAARGSSGADSGFSLNGLMSGLGPALQSASSIMDRQNAARNAALYMPASVDPKYMKPTLDDMVQQIALLRHAQLSGRDQQVAAVNGARAAQARGLSGPIAAALQTESTNQAQQGYNKWRMGQLTAMQPQYLSLLGQYQAGLKQQSDADYARRVAESNGKQQGQNIGQGAGSILDLILAAYGIKTGGALGAAGGMAGKAIGDQRQAQELRQLREGYDWRNQTNAQSVADPYSL